MIRTHTWKRYSVDWRLMSNNRAQLIAIRTLKDKPVPIHLLSDKDLHDVESDLTAYALEMELHDHS